MTHVVVQGTPPAAGASFDAPQGWQVLPIDAASVAVAEPAPDDGSFRANLVLTAIGNGGMDFETWQNGTEQLLPQTLPDYYPIDRERLLVAGRPGGRRLAHQAAPDGSALVTEQWFCADGDTGYTLTATIDALRYDQAAEDLAGIAATLRIGTQHEAQA